MTTVADVRRIGLGQIVKDKPLDARLAWARAVGEAWIRLVARVATWRNR